MNLQNLACLETAKTVVHVLMGSEILEYHSVIRWMTISVDSGIRGLHSFWVRASSINTGKQSFGQQGIPLSSSLQISYFLLKE